MSKPVKILLQTTIPSIEDEKALFKDVNERNRLKLLAAKPLKSGIVKLSYGTQH